MSRLPGDNDTTADVQQAIAAIRKSAPSESKSTVRAVQEDMVDALSALLKARDTLRGISDTLLTNRAQASPWAQKTGAMTALAAAQMDEQIEALFTSLRSVRAV